MNAVHTSQTRKPNAYPNAAGRRYYQEKLRDLILAAVICIGTAGILLFLIAVI